MVAGVELDYDTSASAMQMANTIFGDGVTVTSASYSGSSYSSGIYSNGDAVAGNVTPGDTGVILSTGRATRFTNSNSSQSNENSNTSTNTGGQNNEAGFNALAGASTYDASYMDIDFIPTDDVMTMQFVFSSDEYPEYTNSIYNDAVGVWINGNLVPLAITDNGTTINSINQTNNINLYNDNTSDQFNTEMDGFTLTMTLTIPVNAGVVNSIRIGIADVADSSYDSNLLIAADSIQTELIAEQDFVTMQDSVTKTVDILDNDINNTTGTLTITHINGVAVTSGQTVTLATGQTVKLNADGTVDITTDSDFETSSFTYEVESTDTSGNVLETDVGFVTVETIPCFVAGSMIDTDQGPRAVETLSAGDMVITRDDGPQPVRWIGRRSVPATGKMAPIQIQKNALGDHGELMVSPLHRVLVKDVIAELMFGEAEVLIAAKDLVNDRSIRPVEGGEVEYVHMMFDRHQVVYSEGLATESFLPGPQTTKSFEAEIVEEISTIFPELDLTTGEGYGPAARPMLKRYEAEALLRRVA
ncbi:choice-of-anchor L domain-containing protein [Octadecabacter sp. 1_MG-2023]|uniref:Hint domain-containing protein n=1 Tax=unclassified Octadecabacter TaxID=196158 RepID=UPI001C0A06D8|nr:Hint domain-containing protein [Octadecabacter sp. 1_MG-2023]MBU2992459.1 choice-of-anchor L domain-containing protein [Octadecabacter sp. B2R22]MDO6734785.1 choice-of-anchor L domain-containing protein [Octadecabacter sp. 1_MG-2023]